MYADDMVVARWLCKCMQMKERGAFRVLLDTYVTEETGTGIVHQAPYFGEVFVMHSLLCTVTHRGWWDKMRVSEWYSLAERQECHLPVSNLFVSHHFLWSQGQSAHPDSPGKWQMDLSCVQLHFFQEIDVYRNCSFELLKISSVALAEIISTVACDAELL